MSTSAFTVGNIKPTLNIDSSQRFIFGAPGSPEPAGGLKLDNIYIPIVGGPSILNLESRNNTLSGFRLQQQTTNTDTHGSWKIQSFLNASSNVVDFMTFNENNTITFHVPTNIGTQTITLNGAVSGSGTSTITTTLNSSINVQGNDQTLVFNSAYNPSNDLILKNIANHGAGLNVNTSYVLLNGVDKGYSLVQSSDNPLGDHTYGSLFLGLRQGQNDIKGFLVCRYTDSTDKTSLAIYPDFITLQNNINFYDSSTITVGTGASLTFQSSVIIDLGNNKIINSAAPVNGGDLGNKTYIDDAVANKTITLNGAVSGSGTSTITTTLSPITTSQITDFATAVNSLVDSSFGPNVALPIPTLTYNWTDSGAQIINNLNTAALNESLTMDIVADDTNGAKRRFWRELYTINDSITAGNYAEYTFYFVPSIESTASTVTAYTIAISNSSSVMSLGIPLNASNLPISNLPLPFNGGDATNKTYVDNKTWTSSQISDFATAVNNLVDSSFGPNVALPYTGLNYNFTNSGAQASYIEATNLNDSYAQKSYFYDIAADSNDSNKKRFWREIYSINESIPPLGEYASYGLYFFPSSESGLSNFHVSTIDINSITGAKVSFLVPVSCGQLTVQNIPTDLLDATNKTYVDNKTWASSQITNFTTSVNSLISSATIAPSQLTSFPNNTTTFLRGDGTWANNFTSNIGFGTTNPTQAKIVISGGVQNVVGEDSALRAISSSSSAKIELQNTSASGKLFEIGSTSAGSLVITDRNAALARLLINTAGNLGIAGCTTPNAGLQLGNVVSNRRIVLLEVANNDHQFEGFGINNNVFRYQVDATTVDNVWYAATSTTTSNELWRVKGNGDAILNTGTLWARRPSASINMQNNTTGTSITTANTFVKVAGVTSSTNLNQFSASSNRATYTGAIPIVALVLANFTATYNNDGNDDIIFAIYKNGAQIPESRISFNLNNLLGSIPDLPFSISTTTTMNTNDYVELWVTMSVGGRTVTVSRYMLNAISL